MKQIVSNEVSKSSFIIFNISIITNFHIYLAHRKIIFVIVAWRVVDSITQLRDPFPSFLCRLNIKYSYIDVLSLNASAFRTLLARVRRRVRFENFKNITSNHISRNTRASWCNIYIVYHILNNAAWTLHELFELVFFDFLVNFSFMPPIFDETLTRTILSFSCF